MSKFNIGDKVILAPLPCNNGLESDGDFGEFLLSKKVFTIAGFRTGGRLLTLEGATYGYDPLRFEIAKNYIVRELMKDL